MSGTLSTPPPDSSLPQQYAHTIRYFTKGIDEQGPYYDVEYFISDFSGSDLFLNTLLGYSTLTGGTDGTAVIRAPHRHPLAPNLYCRAAHMEEGLGAPVLNAAGYPSYPGGCLIRATYRPMLPYPVTPDPNNDIDPANPLVYCTQELEFTSEMFTIPTSQLIFTASTKLVGYPFRIIVGVTHLNLTFHKLPYLPMGLIRPLRSRVNAAPFLGAAAGCVLFKNARTRREFNSDGTVTQEVQLTFAERDSTQKWNWLPDPADLVWKQVQSLTGGNPLYPNGNFAVFYIF